MILIVHASAWLLSWLKVPKNEKFKNSLAGAVLNQGIIKEPHPNWTRLFIVNKLPYIKLSEFCCYLPACISYHAESLLSVYEKSTHCLFKVYKKSPKSLRVPVKESRPYNDNLWTHFFLKVDSPFPKSRLSFPWKCTFYENQRYYHSFFFFSCLLRTNLGSSDKSRFEKVSLCSNSSFWYFS